MQSGNPITKVLQVLRERFLRECLRMVRLTVRMNVERAACRRCNPSYSRVIRVIRSLHLRLAARLEHE